jgi:hypothetical protein
VRIGAEFITALRKGKGIQRNQIVLLVPGVSAHSLVNYINAIRLGPATLNPTMSTTPHSKAMVTKDREDKALSDLDITIQQHVKCIQKWHRGQATKSTVDFADFVSGPPMTL